MSQSTAVSSMQEGIKAYIDAGNPLKVPKENIAAWLVRNDLYDVPFEDKIRQCARDLGNAMKAASRGGTAGEKVRKYLSARMPYTDEDGKEVQKWLWDDAATCSGDFYRAAIRHMKGQVVTDLRSIAATVKWGNENNPNLRDNPIQLSFDFTNEMMGDADPRKPR